MCVYVSSGMFLRAHPDLSIIGLGISLEVNRKLMDGQPSALLQTTNSPFYDHQETFTIFSLLAFPSFSRVLWRPRMWFSGHFFSDFCGGFGGPKVYTYWRPGVFPKYLLSDLLSLSVLISFSLVQVKGKKWKYSLTYITKPLWALLSLQGAIVKDKRTDVGPSGWCKVRWSWRAGHGPGLAV